MESFFFFFGVEFELDWEIRVWGFVALFQCECWFSKDLIFLSSFCAFYWDCDLCYAVVIENDEVQFWENAFRDC